MGLFLSGAVSWRRPRRSSATLLLMATAAAAAAVTATATATAATAEAGPSVESVAAGKAQVGAAAGKEEL